MRATQVNVKMIPAREVTKRRHFIMGYDDSSRGASYHKKYDEWDKVDDQWDYERGRLTAAIAKQRGCRIPLFYPGTKTIHPEIVILFENLVVSGDVR